MELKPETYQALRDAANRLRILSIKSTDASNSGHPTSCCSMAEIMSVLFFHTMKYSVEEPKGAANDRFVLSKGHAAPMLYAAWAEAGLFPVDNLLNLRKIDSDLEGHPTPRLNFVDVATGSLGQGLSCAVGMAYTGKYFDKADYRVYCVIGDGEAAEGSIWEAMAFGSTYNLDNCVAIFDVNRLGQSAPTSLQHDTDAYKARAESFGWKTYVVDGHNVEELCKAFRDATAVKDKPTCIIAKTFKGKGVTASPAYGVYISQLIRYGRACSNYEDFIARGQLLTTRLQHQGYTTPRLKSTFRKFFGRQNDIVGVFEKSASGIEDELNWHGKPLGKFSENAREQIEASMKMKGEITLRPSPPSAPVSPVNILNIQLSSPPSYQLGEKVATRQGFGSGLVKLGKNNDKIVAMDGDMKTSTYSVKFQDEFPERFVECFIAEQNLVGVGIGCATRDRTVVFISTYACFLTRAFDQIRMGAVSQTNVNFVGSHCGVSIGEDGPSQMGLEDLAMFRSIPGSTVFYPSDATSCERACELAANTKGICYIRSSRPVLETLYTGDEKFEIGKCKVLRSSPSDQVTVIACCVTLHEALAAADTLKAEGINIRVIDPFTIKPLDEEAIRENANQTGGRIVTVEDHYMWGGLGDAVSSAVSCCRDIEVRRLAVTEVPRSGKPAQLLEKYGISAACIAKAVKSVL